MATTTSADSRLDRADPAGLGVGAGLMSLAGIGFIGYGVIFFVRNFTDYPNDFRHHRARPPGRAQGL
jgi:hypothetical protein